MRAKKSDNLEKLGIYIHIPFCKSKCDYCDFYSLAGAEDRMDAYQKALLAHMKETSLVAGKILVDTVYFGGGTPSYYGEKRLRELLKAIKKLFRVEKDAEITLEANPDSVTVQSLKALRRAGFNRRGCRPCVQTAKPVVGPHLWAAWSERRELARHRRARVVPESRAPVLLRSEGGGWHTTGCQSGQGRSLAQRRRPGGDVPLDGGAAQAGGV